MDVCGFCIKMSFKNAKKPPQPLNTHVQLGINQLNSSMSSSSSSSHLSTRYFDLKLKLFCNFLLNQRTNINNFWSQPSSRCQSNRCKHKNDFISVTFTNTELRFCVVAADSHLQFILWTLKVHAWSCCA